jgi:multimeric flavodoxin WrbA
LHKKEADMKKVVCVLGSPRSNGNSETIARKFLETAESLGAQTQAFSLNNLTFKGCQACMGCKTGSEECVVADDLRDVLRAVRDADVLVMTSPIYFGQITGQLKCFIDRMYSFLKPTYRSSPDRSRLSPGKKLVFITTQGNADAGAFDVYPAYATFLGPEWFGYDTHVIRGLGLGAKTDAAGREDLLKQAEDLAKQLVL